MAIDLAATLSPYATKAVNFLVESLTQLAKDQVKLIAGAEKDFDDLLKEVKPLNVLLAKGYAKPDSSNSVDQWKDFFDDIQRTVYRVEDVIDKMLVQAKMNQDVDLIRFFRAGRLINGWTMGPEIRKNLVEVRRICQESRKVLQQNPQDPPEKSVSSQATQGPVEEDIEVVGFDEPAKEVMARLLAESEDLDVVPIVGMPGLGKTTLARKVFNNRDTNYEFYKTIWVYVGQSYNTIDILVNILKEFTSRTEEYQAKERELVEAIRGFVAAGDKCLIVLDDVWDPKVVESVMKIFPNSKGRHRIIMTSREGHVAAFVNAIPHNLQPLTPEKSFELLEKRVFGKTIKCPIELEGHGKSIVKKCSGVPLAIVVIAGALRGSRDEAKWRVVEENVGKHLIREGEDDPKKNCLGFVKMSYNHLPQDEKAAFLYMGVFPPGFDIPAWKLIRLWVAEGLIQSDLTGSEIEVIAECYLNDFVTRNLVMVMEKRSSGQIKTCRLHDMLHEFCNLEAKRVSLFHQICQKPSDPIIPSIDDPNTSRRLCIESSIRYDVIPKGKEVQHVRSLLCFSSKQKQANLSNLGVKLIPHAFPLIRVMDIQPYPTFAFSREFFKLFHLRYIAISGNFAAGLPSYLGNFWNLQTLILHHTNTSQSTLKVDEGIWKMLRLRHLRTNIPMNMPPPPEQTSTTSCLQTLSKVTPDSCKKNMLAKACNLKKLGVEGRLAALLGANNKGGFDSFEHLNCLEHLKLLNHVSSEQLHLPPTFFSLQQTLRKLTLSDTRFDWSEADKLGQLEYLEVLKLKQNAFMGASWKPGKGSFSKLQVLWIDWASDLETWDASERPFKSLRLLVLKSCPKLKAVPQELADLRHLQEITLERTFQAIDSAEKIESKKQGKQETGGSIKFNLIILPRRAGAKATQQGWN